MKKIEIPLNHIQESILFKPIRSKIDYAHILLLSSKYLLINIRARNVSNSTLKLKFDKTMRLFFYSKNKFFSVAYPFLVNIDNNGSLNIQTLNGKILDSYTISSALSILSDEVFISNPSLVDYFLEWSEPESLESAININLGIAILEEIFQFEPSYIRYDYDEKHNKGKKHPLNHFDICYSSQGTFKIGLENRIDFAFFEDTLDLNTDCIYVK